MLELIVAAALAQAANPCNAIADGAPPAGCPQWRLVRREEGLVAFIDPASFQRDGTAFMVDQRVVFDREQSERHVRSFIQRLRFDCVERTVSGLNIRAFDNAGNMVLEGSSPTPRTGTPAPNSPGEALLAEYCPASGAAPTT